MVDELELGICMGEGVLVLVGSGVKGIGLGGVGWVVIFIFLGFLFLVIDIILRRKRYILNLLGY